MVGLKVRIIAENGPAANLSFFTAVQNDSAESYCWSCRWQPT